MTPRSNTGKAFDDPTAVRPAGHGSSPSVAIVVPLSSRTELTEEERVSLRHLRHYMWRHDKYLIAPAGSAVEIQGFRTREYPGRFFGSVAAHNQLLLWRRFYQSFAEYEYILVYHLDSLVFSDDLVRWCRAGWDFIGAPWLPCSDTPWVREARVGNGGFALMKVSSALRVLANRHRQRPVTYIADLMMRHDTLTRPVWRLLESLHRLAPRSGMLSRAMAYRERSINPGPNGWNNDSFWSHEAVRYLPSFKLAPVEEGLQFAFEAAPRLCFELNQRRLPFGCHAWNRFDRAFWEPYLLTAAADMADSARTQ